MRDSRFDLLTDGARVRLTDHLCALEATEVLGDINYLLDILANYEDGCEINRHVYMLSRFSDMFLGVLTCEDRK